MITARAMTKADVKAVYEIEVLSFRTPWSLRSLMGELKNRVAHYTVLERDGELIGYCGMWVMFEEAHITNIAIHPAFRGHGYGKQLLHAAMRAAASFGAEMMTLEVRETNTVAQRMYDEMDFLQQGRRKKYYSDTGEDALLLWNRNISDTIEKNACLNETYLLQFETFLKGESL
jgi:ribosomal-protein-alanine acetyltransferase